MPRVACRIMSSKFYSNHTSIFLSKIRCNLDMLKVELSGHVGVALEGASLPLRRTTISCSGKTDVDASHESYLVVQHCDLDGRGACPGGLQVSADSHKSWISHSNIRGHTSFGVSFPWQPSGPRVSAQHNYWGSWNGPHDPSNADGWQNYNPGGDFVSDGVDYRHFKRKPFSVPVVP